jgi:hypothetical protein
MSGRGPCLRCFAGLGWLAHHLSFPLFSSPEGERAERGFGLGGLDGWVCR